MLPWYQRRVVALERLLAHYRAGSTPPEALHQELEYTRAFIDSKGQWRHQEP